MKEKDRKLNHYIINPIAQLYNQTALLSFLSWYVGRPALSINIQFNFAKAAHTVWFYLLYLNLLS